MKGKILKGIFAVLSCVCLGAGIVACGGGENSSSSVESSTSVSSSLSVESSVSVEQNKDSFITSVESSTASEESSAESSAAVVNEICFNTLYVDGTTVYGKVSNSATEFSFIDEITVNGTAKFVVALDEYGTQTVVTKTIPLTVGDNTVYVFETVDDEVVTVYEVTVRRRPTYEVSFETNGGTAVEKQVVEEDGFASEPLVPTKGGYTFDGWEYDFSTPITGNKLITAKWEAVYYPITYDFGGGTIENDENPTSYTVEMLPLALSSITPTKVNYGFLGWYDGEKKVESIEQGNCTPLHLTAKWEYALVISGNELRGVTDSAKTTCIQISVPDNVTAISSYAFADNKYLKEVEIGDSVVSIGKEAFSNCGKLRSVTIGKGITTIKEKAFYNCSMMSVYITDVAAWCNITFADDNANPISWTGGFYQDGEYVKELIIPDTVTKINSYAFHSCASLKSVIIPDSVTAIGDYAFYRCSKLKNIKLGESITSIGDYAFAYSENLLSIEIPSSVTSVGYEAFHGSGLTDVYITDIAAWCNISFNYVDDGYYYDANPLSVAKNLYLNGELVTELVIPDEVTEIKSYAFVSCNSLTSVVIHSNVKQINRGAFYACSQLTGVYITDLTAWCNITFGGNSANPLAVAGNLYVNDELVTTLIIPDSVTEINKYAFENCDSLTRIVIHKNFYSISYLAFYNCSNLSGVYYEGNAWEWEYIKNYHELEKVTKYYYVENRMNVPTDGGNYWHYDENGDVAVW